MGTITYSGTLTVVSCWCGIKHAVPYDLYEHAQGDSTFTVYCPVGHGWVARESKSERFARELEMARSREVHLRDQRDAAQRSANAYKGQATKIRKRVAKGIRPCCNRSFANLARHMAGQHPDYGDGHTDG